MSFIRKILYGEENENEDEFEEFVKFVKHELREEASKNYEDQDKDKVNDLLRRLERAKEIAGEDPPVEERKPWVSGDTLVKVGAVVGLAAWGWYAEQTGHLLPKCFQFGGPTGIFKL